MGAICTHTTGASTPMQVDFGKRLKQEREGLGLSQAEFAQKMGIHRNTQVRYENGLREPDTVYLENLRRFGVDVDYVLTGETSFEKEAMNVVAALGYALKAVSNRLGTKDEAFDALYERALEAPDTCVPGNHGFDVLVDGMFEGCRLEVDGALLVSILEGVEGATRTTKAKLTPAKKAQAVVMLYRAFKASGKADPAMIEEAVRLASG